MTIVTMETGEKMHPFTRLIALPEPIADLDQVTTVGQARTGDPVASVRVLRYTQRVWQPPAELGRDEESA